VDALASSAGLARLEARRSGDAARAATVLERARAAGVPFFEAWALHAQGEATLARGELDAALASFEAKAALLDARGMEDPDLSPAPELVEVLLRLGRDDEARALAADAGARAAATGRPWARARAHRAAALATIEDAAALERLRIALVLHAAAHDPFEEARTRLCLGERLRRAGRRSDARPPLRDALASFDALGAGPWSERARAELKATGETVRRRDPSSLDELTPQELRVAMTLAEGATTREAAAALYLSPKTVEYHLRHVYLKLGVNSRAALAGALRPDGATAALPARG
jgi:DNA-binding CsgD family transcriptional regulator